MCEHQKPWAVSVEVEVITEKGRNRPGRAAHVFECRKCGSEVEWKWTDESSMTFSDALSYGGLKSWGEARQLPVEPAAQAEMDARHEQRRAAQRAKAT